MFLTLVVCQLAVVAANPFHKYPYVFLLDVGNEELENTSLEQIRLTVPGGSLALRYPAIGDGDIISHVRVSGIDFGTELKATIADGGPGYKYVVLVFMSNPGVPFDAVMTIKSIKSSNLNEGQSNGLDEKNESDEITDTMNKESQSADENASDDNNDELDMIASQNTQITQGSSNIYRYAKKEAGDKHRIDENDNDNDDDSDDNSEDDSDEDSDDDSDEDDDDIDDDGNEGIHKQYSARNFMSTKDNKGDNDAQNRKDSNLLQENETNDDEESNENAGASAEDENELPSQNIIVMRPFYYGGIRLYPQNRVPFVFQDNSPGYDSEDSFKFGQSYDEDENNESDELKDLNNNNFDTDDSFAIVS
jgi:hypothetical protein